MCQSFLFSHEQKVKSKLIDLIFPKKCFGCRWEGDWLCQSCFSQLLLSTPIRREINQSVVWSFTSYQNKTVQNLINALKYQGITDIIPIVSQLLSVLASSFISNLDLITAIPLHPKKQAQRTYNQSELIGLNLASKLEVPYLTTLKRLKYTESQTHLSDQERMANLQGVFQAEEKAQKQIIGRRILLIDDVVTSGATISQAIEVLRNQGAAEVICLTLASG